MASFERAVSALYTKLKGAYDRVKKSYSQKIMFVEGISIDEVWEEVKKTIGSGYLYFVTTPVNYELNRLQLNIKVPKQKWEKLILKRYNWLKNQGERIELHVHLALNPCHMRYSEQKEKITKAYKWMKENGFNPKLFIPGWWVWNTDTEKIINNLRLQLVKPAEHWTIHDYELIWRHYR